jgi:folate-binding protein YgfZ
MHQSLHAEILLLEGPDAATFAHAQFSSKVDALVIGQWQFSAWLDAGGRVRTFFHLARLEQERYLLLLRGGSASAMAETLHRFVFRAKVRITALPARALSTGAAQAMHALNVHDDVLSLGCGSHSLDVVPPPASNDAWQSLQLHEGWPWLPDSALDALLPSALSLQRLHAVAVDKGCYPGQEIVARLHFRGGNKQHLHRGRLSQPIASGEMLRIDGQDVGRVLNGDEHNDVLAVLSDTRVSQAEPGTTHAFDNQMTMKIEASWPA